MALPNRSGPYAYRTVFISDIHLGTRGCQAALLLDFLKNVDAETYYLVGDIVDGWQLERSWYWPREHTEVVQAFIEKARSGARVVYIPGNHDEVFRRYLGMHFAGIEVKLDDVHETADGRRLLILHGDAFDSAILCAKWLTLLGNLAYATALNLNTAYNRLRRLFGLDYWSLSAWLKFRVKNAVQFISRFEEAVSAEARRRRVDGVVCGHIHHAEIRKIDGILYANDGDWVESCAALVEDRSGELMLIHWSEVMAARAVGGRLRQLERAA